MAARASSGPLGVAPIAGEVTMRAADCPLCGQHLEAEDDDALFQKGRAHADEKHADQSISDEQIREVPTRDA